MHATRHSPAGTLALRGLLVAVGLSLWAGPLAAREVVIVAPLHDAAPVADADAAQGVTDLVAGVLAEKITVIAGDQLEQLLREQELSVQALTEATTAARAGKLLKADYILTGSVFRRDGRIEFALQLLDVDTRAVVKGLKAEGPADDLLATASDLARQCAAALHPAAELPQGEPADVRRLARERFFLEALGFYHAGDYDRAILYCLRVIELDPNNERARLRLAESFLAAGEPEQARITLSRTLQLFPETRQGNRAQAILGRLQPSPIQAVEKTTVDLPLPKTWPANVEVDCKLSWEDQRVLEQTVTAKDGRIRIEMPGARVPLSLKMVLSCEGHPSSTSTVRLWPADAGLRQPEERPLVVVDPKHAVDGLLEDLKYKHYSSCRSIPGPETRLVIVADDQLKMTPEQAKAVTAFVTGGGQVTILGRLPDGMEIAGLRQTTIRWPVSHSWRPMEGAPAWSYIPPEDVISAVASVSECPAVTGGATWLAATERHAGLIASTSMGAGHLLWICWPFDVDANDPRYARLLALAIGDAARPAEK